MTRGDVVTVALSGEFGKPRPAVVIQSDLFAGHTTVTILLVTSTVTPGNPLFRLRLVDVREMLRKVRRDVIEA